jgi:hypothetical protein
MHGSDWRPAVQKLFAVTTELQCSLDLIRRIGCSERAKVFDVPGSLRDRTVN